MEQPFVLSRNLIAAARPFINRPAAVPHTSTPAPAAGDRMLVISPEEWEQRLGRAKIAKSYSLALPVPPHRA